MSFTHGKHIVAHICGHFIYGYEAKLQDVCCIRLYNLSLSLSLSLNSRAHTHTHTHTFGSRTHTQTQSALKPDQHTYMLLLNLIAVIAKEDKAAQPAAAKEVLNVLSQVSLFDHISIYLFVRWI